MQKNMKKLKIAIVIIMVLSIVNFILSAIVIVVSGTGRENYAINLTDENVKSIENIIGTVADKSVLSDNAVKVEYIALMHKDAITVYYDDESEQTLCIDSLQGKDLSLYFKENGYNVYFNRLEFVADLAKGVLSFLFFIWCVIFYMIFKKSSLPQSAALTAPSSEGAE